MKRYSPFTMCSMKFKVLAPENAWVAWSRGKAPLVGPSLTGRGWVEGYCVLNLADLMDLRALPFHTEETYARELEVAIMNLLEEWVPITMKAFRELRLK